MLKWVELCSPQKIRCNSNTWFFKMSCYLELGSSSSSEVIGVVPSPYKQENFGGRDIHAQRENDIRTHRKKNGYVSRAMRLQVKEC